MIKNYFILNRIALELNSILKHAVITEIFSQEKNRFIFKCVGNEVKYIEISVNPGLPYITLKNEYHRAKKNSLDFFNEYLPLKIEKFEISERDRIIKVKCVGINFYFAVRGKYTNIFLETAAKSLDSFKKEDEIYLGQFHHEVAAHIFISEKNYIDFAPPNLEPDEYRKRYPILGKEIIAEAKFRGSECQAENSTGYLPKIIEELFKEDPAVFISASESDLYLAVKTFHIFPYDEVKVFDLIIEAQNYYLSKKFYFDALVSGKKLIEKHIERELSRLSSKMNDLEGRIERGSNEDEYNKTGNLLLINLSRIPRKSSYVELEDTYENNKIIKVKLDPKLTPQQNAQYYFTKASNEKKAYKKSTELLREISKRYNRLLKIKENFIITDKLDELNIIMKELNIKHEEKKDHVDELKSKFKHYILEKKYDVFVGKDSANNDLLTMKYAKQNDYWFHARSVPGSHVVLRVVNTKEPVPKNILKKAASLAAFHSKAKTSSLAPVSYTMKKYVSKRKGMEPGKVSLAKEDVLLVKPEIPAQCEYVSGD